MIDAPEESLVFDFDDYIDQLLQMGLVRHEQIIGCSKEEISEIKQAQGVGRLPRLYEQFLRRMGRDPDWLEPGEAWSIDDVLQMKDDARHILTRNNADTWLLERSVIFQYHVDYAFCYFPAERITEDDPPVLEWSPEYNTGSRCIADSFSAYLNSRINGLKAYHTTIQRLTRRKQTPHRLQFDI